MLTSISTGAKIYLESFSTYVNLWEASTHDVYSVWFIEAGAHVVIVQKTQEAQSSPTAFVQYSLGKFIVNSAYIQYFA